MKITHVRITLMDRKEIETSGPYDGPRLFDVEDGVASIRITDSEQLGNADIYWRNFSPSAWKELEYWTTEGPSNVG